jgi:hypothetical protein
MLSSRPDASIRETLHSGRCAGPRVTTP